MNFKKTIAAITASACALSAFSFFPSISEASELNKSTKSVEVQNITNDLNSSFVTNYASLDLDAGTSYVDVSPGGGSDGYNQYVSSRTVRNTANERSLLIGLYSLAGGFWLGLGASIVGYLNGNQTWDYAQKTLYRHPNGSYKVSTLLYKNGTIVASGKSKVLSYKQLGTWYY
ncbi:hypothetical protein [Bacillus toyonensis]|uniref:hypothetical protein n=1 Tax=Bacillus toyonensis TaxID=155322 RepID=UPI00027A0632|nr:hypothetical protein [Bacillus toyonensis]EJR41422.1 hypothetical protein IIK_05821 [Bacillus cereus VD102]MBU4643216.1 hypothetical protein [Bacillus toyonensis]